MQFYPGRFHRDTGFLDYTKIINTLKRDNEIIHIVKSPIQAGTRVQGTIDYERRFRFMQQHTGEHILSGVLKQLFHCANVGFHIGADFVTIDVNCKLTPSQLEEAETIANKSIYENRPIEILYPDPETLKNINYRSKGNLQGHIRIVSIPEYDICACCGLHCSHTGEVGIIKILSSQSYKGGTRILLLCGQDALIDYRNKYSNIYRISAALSVRPNETADSVNKLKEELNQIRYELNSAKKQILKFKAEKFPEGSNIIITFDDTLKGNEVGIYCSFLAQRCKIAALFCKDISGGYKYAIASQQHDVRHICKQINFALNGKGGGMKEIVQGNIKSSRKNIEKQLMDILS